MLKVIGDEAVCLFEGGDTEVALRKSDGDHFDIGELWLCVEPDAPVGKARVLLEETHKHIQAGHLVGAVRPGVGAILFMAGAADFWWKWFGNSILQPDHKTPQL